MPNKGEVVIKTNTGKPCGVNAPKVTAFIVLGNYKKDKKAVEAWKFLLNRFTILKSATIVQVMKQTLSGYNYKFTVQVKYTTQINLTYILIVHISTKNVITLTSGDFSRLPQFQANRLVRVININSITYINIIQQQIRSLYANDLNICGTLQEVWADEPYYTFIYVSSQGAIFRITFLFEILSQKISVISVERSNAPIVNP